MPTGLTTFLFSDIVASTRRWEGDPDAMAVDLARHDELLRVLRPLAGRSFATPGMGWPRRSLPPRRRSWQRWRLNAR